MTIKKFSPNDIKKNEVVRINEQNGDLRKMVFLHDVDFGVSGSVDTSISVINLSVKDKILAPLHVIGDITVVDDNSNQNSSPTLTLSSTHSGGANGPVIRLQKNGSISDSTNMGEIWFYGDANSDGQYNPGAYIIGEGDGTWTDSSAHPSRIIFATTSATSQVIRMGIRSNGSIVIGSNATAAHSECAILESTSTTQGFLPPRMTTTQRDAIASPVAGLMAYNTSTNKLNFYNGSAWEQVTSST